MNRLLKLAGEKAEIPTDFAIRSEDLIFTGVPCTCLEKCPNTKTGKVPRYIVILHFAAKPTPESEASDQYSGKIFFLQDGAPGKGFISCWKNTIFSQLKISRRHLRIFLAEPLRK